MAKGIGKYGAEGDVWKWDGRDDSWTEETTWWEAPWSVFLT